LKVFNELDGQYKASSQPRILVELGLLKLVEFISQEKKKSQPSVAPEANGTDQYLPDALPKRGDAPAPPAPAPVTQAAPAPATPAAAPTPAPAPVATEAPSTAPAPETVPAASQIATPVHNTVSDSNLPKETAVPETPAMAPPPEASPAAAFDLPKEGRRRRTTGKKKGGLSLTAMMEEMASENEPTKPTAESGDSDIPAAAEGPQNVYTENELKLALEEYTKQRHVKTAIRSMLQAQVPKILDKNTLEITVDNNIQQGYFNDEQKELVPWLRRKLDNFALRFEVKMAENVQTKKLYLPEEKFKHMVEKNPNLLYLREKLNTDLE
jgi:hypothetical protein